MAQEIITKTGKYMHPNESIPMPCTTADVLKFMGLQGLHWTKKTTVYFFRKFFVDCDTHQTDGTYIDWLSNDVDLFWLKHIEHFALGGILCYLRAEGPSGSLSNEAIIVRVFDSDVIEIPADVVWPMPAKMYYENGFATAYKNTRLMKYIRAEPQGDIGNDAVHYEKDALVNGIEEPTIDAAGGTRDGSSEHPLAHVPLIQYDTLADELEENDDDGDCETETPSGSQDTSWYNMASSRDDIEMRAVSTMSIEVLDEIDRVVKQEEDEEADFMNSKIAGDHLASAYAKFYWIKTLSKDIPKSVLATDVNTELERRWI